MEKMKNEYSKIVGNNIRKYREMNYMSQTELANRIGVKQAAISLYENGELIMDLMNSTQSVDMSLQERSFRLEKK